MTPPTDRIPVTVLTGFLGSGKTVLLNALLQQPGFADSAVVVNEFGEIGLDHLLVSSAKENIILLDAGCLCCAVLGSLKETLLDLHHRRARSELPPFRRVLVETTGLADPGPIVQSIMRDPLVAHFYRLAGLVCVVDALHGEAQLTERPEAQAQVAYADRIVVTKTDRLEGRCPDHLAQRLRELNPGAEQLVASFGRIAAEALLQAGAGREGVPWLGTLAAADTARASLHVDGAHEHDHVSHASHGAIHDRAIQSQNFLFDGAVTWSGLAAWIEAVRARYGRDLLRCKGIANIGGAPVVVHGVQSLFETRRLAAWPDAERRSRLVLIGKGLVRDELANSLGWLGVAEGTLPPLVASLTPPPLAADTASAAPIVLAGVHQDAPR